jgi:Ca2+-dependent lipid-binding protein
MASRKLETPVNLYISCEDLRDADLTSKSDPRVTVMHHERHSDTWREVGRTEVVKNSLNPSFATPIKVTYSFEEVQKLKFRVDDVDPDLLRDTVLGLAETTLGSLVGNQTTKLPLKEAPLSKGFITIVAEQGSETGEMVTFNFRATNLDKKV